MIPLIENNKQELKQICEKHNVSQLFLFGSAAKGNFNPKSSDLDMVVEFSNKIDPLDYAENFFSLLESLENLFNLKVELLSLKALKNTIMIREIENSKVQLYAA